MSDFSADWLALREPADLASRAGRLLERIGADWGQREAVTVADLGCGTGSVLRALAPVLGPRQTWLLVDRDERLLNTAQARLAAWADEAGRNSAGHLVLREGDKHLTVQFITADLAQTPLPDATAGADLITASALFDLVSRAWTGRFVEALARRRQPLYAALTYDGVMSWKPGHPFDADAVAAFNRHQRTDKGLGAALGPDAAQVLAEILTQAGYEVDSASSPWRLGPADAQLALEHLEGVVTAVRELADLDPGDIEAWRRFHLHNAGEGVAVVGHMDVLARIA